MDIHPYLEIWRNLEPALCEKIHNDIWQFTFKDNMVIRCDVVSFHGTGIIEDLISETIGDREGWSYSLTFDRASESFSAAVTIAEGKTYDGLVSLNPGISLLSAYLRALKGHNLLSILNPAY